MPLTFDYIELPLGDKAAVTITQRRRFNGNASLQRIIIIFAPFYRQ